MIRAPARTLARVLAVLTGLSSGLALGLLIAFERYLPAVTAIVVAGLLAVLISRFPVARREIGWLVALTYAVHLVAVTVIHFGSVPLGLGGFVVGDDANYARVSWRLAQALRGVDVGAMSPDYYLFGTYVYLETLVFSLFGPDVLIVQVMNAGFATAITVFVYELASSLFFARAARLAALFVAFFPSLVLWSSLNLKDALALLLIALVFWLVFRFQSHPAWASLAAAGAPLVIFPTLRRYVFLELAVILVLVPLVLIAGARLGSRLAWATAAAMFGTILAVFTPTAQSPLLLPTLEALERARYSMGVGARTGYQNTFAAREGETYIVTLVSTSQTSEPVPSTATAIRYVPPGTELVLVLPGATAPADLAPGAVLVRPGDIVVVGGPGTTPQPEALRQRLLVTDVTPTVRLADAGTEPVLTRTLSYLPRGVAYALFAPFPWAARRSLDLLTLPEMLLWYALLPAALVTLWRYRERWQFLAPTAIFVAGSLGIFALVEGNVGTLFRHRAMVIPSTILLAAPTLVLAFDRARTWRRPPSGRTN